MIEIPNNYKIEESYKENEKEYTITLKMKIPKTKRGEYYINRMINKQENPIVTIMKEVEKEHRTEYKEQKTEKQRYTREIFENNR